MKEKLLLSKNSMSQALPFRNVNKVVATVRNKLRFGHCEWHE